MRGYAMTAMEKIQPTKSIKPRKVRLPFNDVTTTYFYDNNALISAFMAALSATFPPGEKSFIDAVRHYRDQIDDPELQAQIQGFIGQEGHHSHQHKEINRKLDDLGLYATRLEAELEARIEKEQPLSKHEDRLAFTAGMEHMTAIMAEYILTHQDVLDPLPNSTRELLLWHAVEEIEHKAVAFDVYDKVVGDRNKLRIIMAVQTFEFVRLISSYQFKLLWWAKKVPSLKDVFGAAKFLAGKNGLLPNIAKPYLDYYRKDFHPWDNNNQALIDAWKRDHPDLANC